jgi:hypothetical protein
MSFLISRSERFLLQMNGSSPKIVRGCHRCRPGSRAYVSAGLPGAEWWVAGPAVDRAEAADVDLAEVEQFFIELGIL